MKLTEHEVSLQEFWKWFVYGNNADNEGRTDEAITFYNEALKHIKRNRKTESNASFIKGCLTAHIGYFETLKLIRT